MQDSNILKSFGIGTNEVVDSLWSPKRGMNIYSTVECTLKGTRVPRMPSIFLLGKRKSRIGGAYVL